MAKIPGLSNIAGDSATIQQLNSSFGSSVGAGINSAINKLPSVLNNAIDSKVQEATNKLLRETGITKALGSAASHPILGGIVGDLLGLGTGKFYSAIKSRDDPLFQMDWMIQLPLGLPWYFVEEIQFPMQDFTVSPGIFRAGVRKYYAEVADIAPVTINFYEDRKLTVTKWLQKWRSMVQNADGTYNTPLQYKQNFVLQPMDAKGNVLGTFTLVGCFPSKIPTYPFVSATSERMVLSVEFSVDNCELLAKSGVQGGSLLGGITGAIGNAAGGIIGSGLNLINEAATSATNYFSSYFD